MSVQYGTHVWTLLLIHSRWGTNAWGRWNYLGLDLDDIGSFDSPPQLRRGGPQRH